MKMIRNSVLAMLSGTTIMLSLSLANGPAALSARLTGDRLDRIERNIVAALESGSPGLEASAALTLRDLKLLRPSNDFSRTVIPLMRIVKDEGENARTRVAAALALHELHSAVGDFAISRAAIFTDDHLVKHILSAIESHRADGERHIEQDS